MEFGPQNEKGEAPYIIKRVHPISQTCDMAYYAESSGAMV